MNTATKRFLIHPCLVLAGLIIFAGCVTPGARASNPFGSWDGDCVTIVVENHGFYDATIYIVKEGLPFRLGSVGGLGTATFRADRGLIGRAGSYQLMADYIGSKRRTTTHSLPPIFGSTTLWRLEQSDWQSTVVIR